MAEFNRLPFEYDECRDARDLINTKKEKVSGLSALQTIREWSEFFRRQYKTAVEMGRRSQPDET